MEARNEMVVTRGYEMDKILPNEGNRSWTRKKNNVQETSFIP